jgi:8-oxo-dGTP diphosphatase
VTSTHTYTETFPRIGSAALVVDHDRDHPAVLLGERGKDPMRGQWVLPGGRINAFETIAKAAAREVFEETGLQIIVDELPFAVYEIISYPTHPDEHRIILYSKARLEVGVNPVTDRRIGGDLTDAGWFTGEELADAMRMKITPATAYALAKGGWL